MLKELLEAKKRKKKQKGFVDVAVDAYDNVVSARMSIMVRCDRKDADKMRRITIRKPRRTDTELYVMRIDNRTVMGRGDNPGKILPAFILGIEDPDIFFGYVNGNMYDIRRGNLRPRTVERRW